LGIAFPPEDWIVFPDVAQVGEKTDPAQETPRWKLPLPENEIVMALGEPDTPQQRRGQRESVSLPGGTTDCLLATRPASRATSWPTAKQQIQAATRGAARKRSRRRRRLSFEQWEQKVRGWADRNRE